MTNLFSDAQLADFMPNFSEIDEGEEQQNQQQQSTNIQHLHVATSISHVKAPEFDGVNPRRWLKRFKAACDMNKWNDSQRINLLRQLMKENSVADSWFETRYKDSLPKTMEEFEKYLVGDLGYPDEKEQKFKKMIDRTQEIGESPQDFYFHKLALIDDYGGIDDSFKVFLINNGLDSEYRDSLTLSCGSPSELLKILKKKEQAKQMAPQSIYPNLMNVGQPCTRIGSTVNHNPIHEYIKSRQQSEPEWTIWLWTTIRYESTKDTTKNICRSYIQLELLSWTPITRSVHYSPHEQ